MLSNEKVAISFCIHCTITMQESSWSSFVMLSNESPHPWKLQNRYVCPDGIFPAGPLLASGRPKESHFSSHFIGPYHLHLSSRYLDYGNLDGRTLSSGFYQTLILHQLTPCYMYLVSGICSWCNFFCLYFPDLYLCISIFIISHSTMYIDGNVTILAQSYKYFLALSCLFLYSKHYICSTIL